MNNIKRSHIKFGTYSRSDLTLLHAYPPIGLTTWCFTLQRPTIVSFQFFPRTSRFVTLVKSGAYLKLLLLYVQQHPEVNNQVLSGDGWVPDATIFSWNFTAANYVSVNRHMTRGSFDKDSRNLVNPLHKFIDVCGGTCLAIHKSVYRLEFLTCFFF